MVCAAVVEVRYLRLFSQMFVARPEGSRCRWRQPNREADFRVERLDLLSLLITQSMLAAAAIRAC